MSERVREIVAIFGFCVLIVVALGVVWLLYPDLYPSNPIGTKALTILHTWEEGGQYYFSDELGYVYLIACRGEFTIPKREIRYDDMPKIRYGKLKEGHRYHVEYALRGGDVRLSLGEKEMER